MIDERKNERTDTRKKEEKRRKEQWCVEADGRNRRWKIRR